jgi:tripartite-type tricarboxylate transporter receptor subunit TctC
MQDSERRAFLRAVALLAVGATVPETRAQGAYPNKAIKIIAPVQPGGGVPTFEEQGYKDFDGVQWYGIVGPANLPPDIVKRLSTEINQQLATPELRERLSAEALEPMPMTPEQFGAYMRSDIAHWSALAKARNIQIVD